MLKDQVTLEPNEIVVDKEKLYALTSILIELGSDTRFLAENTQERFTKSLMQEVNKTIAIGMALLSKILNI
ncbi:MAG: hypothetical protein FWB72_00430 [Firmicutes bacterium]|nr:hypothetical protein [Bacillota bacterium]